MKQFKLFMFTALIGMQSLAAMQKMLEEVANRIRVTIAVNAPSLAI